MKNTANKLWLIDYENAHWCGGQLNVVVVAETADEARYLAEDHMEEAQYELFSDHYLGEIDVDYEEGDYEAPYATVNSVEEFNESHESWQFYTDPSQEQFYPTIGKFL